MKIFHQSIEKIIFSFATKTSAKIIIFFVSINTDFDYEFRKWHYAQVQIIHAVDSTIFIVEKCFDFDCTMSLIDRNFLTTISHDEIRTTTQFIRVRNINFRQHDNSEYVKLKFYIRDKTVIDKFATVHFRREVHVVNDLKIRIFIDMNIIESKIIDVLINNNILHVENCDVIAFIIIKFKNNNERINRIIRVITIVIISFHFTIAIIVKFRDKLMSIDRNYFFHFISNVKLKSNDEFFVHIVDVNVDVVQIRNVTNKSCIIFRNVKIDKFHDFEKENCYVVDSKNRHLAAITIFNWIIKLKHLTILEFVIFVDVKKIITVSVSKLKKSFFIIAAAFSININISFIFEISNSMHDWWKTNTNIYFSIILSSNVSKRVTSNDITIYDNVSTYDRFFVVANAYFDIWRDSENIVNISKKNWMSISTITETKSNAFKVYFLESENRTIIDKEFDRLHVENKMNWIIEFTSYDYSCFVIWKIVHVFDKTSKRKNKIIINIREFNKIFMFDAYFMTLQSDMIIFVINSFYISFMNIVSFFHQWLVKLTNRHKLIVVTHKDSEQWNVIVMKYRNSSIYVQRQIDIILRKYRHFVKAYVDDIVIFFNTLKKHLKHLTFIFALFKKYNIVIKTFKIYFDYFIIALLNQRVNNFDLFIVEDKLKIIFDLKFFHIFKHLKIYFDKIEYLRQYVIYYAQKTVALQRRKTRLLRDALNKKRTRKMHSTRILIDSFISKK